jgi:hypothetical protein
MLADIQQWMNAEHELLFNTAPRVPGNVLNTEWALFKFKEVTACEVLGYQFAAAIGVPVARMQPVWSDRIVPMPDGQEARPYRVGILIEWHEGMIRLSREEAFKRYPVEAARALALCVFDRYEWGEFAVVGNTPYFIDLERLFPKYFPDYLMELTPREQEKELKNANDYYYETGPSSIREVLEEATRINASPNVVSEMRQIIRDERRILKSCFRLREHPFELPLNRWVKKAARDRIRQMAQVVGN